MSNIQIILSSDCAPNISVLVNQNITQSHFNKIPDQYGNLILTFSINLTKKDHIQIVVDQVTGYVKIVDIIADDIRLGLVTFLCCQINEQQDTQLNTNGTIDIRLSGPIWKFWCDKMNEFNYKDYPLGSAN
jgi:hypothetical protein